MHKIKETKYLSILQVKHMAENIREKFNRYSCIQISVNAHMHWWKSKNTLEYWVYIEGNEGKYIYSWKELLSYYEKLMKGKTCGQAI